MDLYTILDARRNVATNFYTNLGWGNKFCICILSSICEDATTLVIMEWLRKTLRF